MSLETEITGVLTDKIDVKAVVPLFSPKSLEVLDVFQELSSAGRMGHTLKCDSFK